MGESELDNEPSGWDLSDRLSFAISNGKLQFAQ